MPLRQGDATAMLGELRDRRVRLLSAPERDVLVTAIERIAAMAWDLRDTVADIDVNPVALTRGGEAMALDALIARADKELSA